MKTSWGAVFLILELCLLSALAVEILPQTELRELDIFMQDEEYQQITRAKRTDEDIQEEEGYSGEGPLPIPEVVFKTDENADQNESEKENSTNETPPASPGPSFKFKIEPRFDTVDSGPVSRTELPTTQNESVNLDNSEIQSITVSSLESVPSPEQPISTDASKLESVTSDVNSSTDTTDNAELSPPIIGSSSEFSKDNTSESETTQDTTEANPPEILREIGLGNATLNGTQNTTDIPPQSILPGDNGNTTANSTVPTNPIITSNTTDNNVSTSNSTNISNNTTVTDNSGASKVNSTNTNPTDVAPTKPVIGESDQTKQGSVSGSGVLFTIIILVVIAGLAALGYVIYKKRTRGYTPVNVNEDQGKEMNDIENGFGKPIRADEVRIEDQLTPTQPMLAPRTFMTPPTERKLSDAGVKTYNDRSTREESIEIEEEEEERKKTDE